MCRLLPLSPPSTLKPQLLTHNPKMTDEFNPSCPIPLSHHATVQMAHGSGGRLMRQLIEEMFLPTFRIGPDGGSPQPVPMKTRLPRIIFEIASGASTILDA